MAPAPKITIVPKVALKQTLTPGLVQMVNLLAMNKLELQEAISQELLENPMLEEGQAESGQAAQEELTRLERSLQGEDAAPAMAVAGADEGEAGGGETPGGEAMAAMVEAAAPQVEVSEAAAESPAADAFEEIDYGDFFKDYLDPGFQQPATEIERPSFDNFISAPTTLTDHLRWQLSVEPIEADLRAAAEAIIGNLDEDGYFTAEDDKGRRPLRVEELAA